MEEYIEIIESECRAYIAHHWGRIDAVLRIEYFDPETMAYGTITDSMTGEPVTDPYRLTILQLAAMTRYKKRIEMNNTVSYMIYFSMYPEDCSRIRFLAEIRKKISSGEDVSQEEAERLKGEHEHFSEKWKDADPWQFYDDDPMHGLGIG